MRVVPMSTKLQIKPLNQKLVEIFLDLVREYYQYDGLKYSRKRAESGAREILKNPKQGRAWVIHLNEEHVGYLVITFGFSLEFGGRYILIDELYLQKHVRGRGFGLGILKYAQEFALKEGIRVLRLEVETDNRKAVSIYKKFGFHQHERFIMTKLPGQRRKRS